MEAVKDLIEKIGYTKAATVGGTILACAIFFIMLIARTKEPDMGLLFSQIDPADGGRIIERLKSLNIPVDIKGENNQIYVPTDQVARLRMELATDGLPAGGIIGYEIFDKTDVLGTTHALMDINFLRATEGELSKSVRTIQGVQSARVHLVIPKRELFSEEKSSPSASIIIKMKGTSRLSVNQVLSIQHLVASAVPNLMLDKISIIDDKGTLLAQGHDGRENSPESSSFQHEARQAFEGKLSRSIESLLERTLGPGRVRTEISADLDFDKITSTSVEFNPDGQVARTIQNVNEGSTGNDSSAADAITVQNALPDGTNNGQGNQSKTQSNRIDENTAFEISNTTRTHIKESGGIKRLSIAVLVDGTYKKEKNGKETYAPRTAEEITQITDLVKSASGLREDRGDTIKVINMRFTDTNEPEVKIDTLTKILNVISSSKFLEMLTLFSIAMFLFFAVIKPLIAPFLPERSKPQSQIHLNLLENESEGDEHQQYAKENIFELTSNQYSMQNIMNPQFESAENEDSINLSDENEKAMHQIHAKKLKKSYDISELIDVDSIDGRLQHSSVKKICEIIEKHPEEAVAIIRSWIHTDYS